MTYTQSRIDAHLNGDCDTATCPLCELDALDESVLCDQCSVYTTDPEQCPHGREHCPECAESNRCTACIAEGRP